MDKMICKARVILAQVLAADEQHIIRAFIGENLEKETNSEFAIYVTIANVISEDGYDIEVIEKLPITCEGYFDKSQLLRCAVATENVSACIVVSNDGCILRVFDATIIKAPHNVDVPFVFPYEEVPEFIN